MKTAGEKIKELRTKSKITQKKLCEYLEIDQSLLSRIENNERPISIEQFDKLSSLFGFTFDEFEKDNISISPLNISLRSSQINNDDLIDISTINNIANESKQMADMLRSTK